MPAREDAVTVARRLLPKVGAAGTRSSSKAVADRRGWLSAAGAYCPIGTPELDLCETPRERRRRGSGNTKAGKQATASENSQWLPMIHDPSDRVADYNAAAFSHLRREIRRSSRAIPACKAGQDLQDVMENPLLHTQPLAAARDTTRMKPRHEHGHADARTAQRKVNNGRGKKKGAAEQDVRSDHMPEPLMPVIKSKGPAVQSTFESDAKQHRVKIAARQPASFAAMTPRHADEHTHEMSENENEYANDAFEADEPGASEEEPSEEEHEDAMLNEMLDELHSRRNKDVQKRMNEHGRNWRLVNSKANNELVEKLEGQKEQREQRAHSKLRVATTVSSVGTGSAAAKARRHQMAFMAAKRLAKAQARFLRKHKIYAAILQMIVERCNGAQLVALESEDSTAPGAAGQGHAPPPSRPRPTPLEQIVLGKLKVALLERAGLLERTGPPSQWEAEEAPIVPGPKGAVDPKKVVLHKMVAREIFYSSIANDTTLPLEAFAEPEVQNTIAFLRSVLVVPDDSYRHWLGQRSMMHYYTEAPAVAGFAAAPPMEPIETMPRHSIRT